jgi:organic hydroperoxide reductase OsmC/OhrA
MSFEPRVYSFETGLTWKEARLGELTLAGDRAIRVACPKEFGGPDGEWTPEHLFVASVQVCIMTTFLWLIESEGVRIGSYECRSKGEATTRDGEFRFTRIVVRPHVRCENPGDVGKAMKLLERAHRECLISKSLSLDVILSPEVKAMEG